MNRKRNRHSKHSRTHNTSTPTTANTTTTTEAFLMGFGLGAALIEFLAAGFGYF